MRILITGATGFLGAALTSRLLDDGAEVRLLARAPGKAQMFVAHGAELVEGDITDREAIRRALEGVTVVYHLAGKLFIPGVPAEEYRRIHVEGTRALLDACARLPEIRRFVHCSTTGVFGTTGDIPAAEDARYAPTNAYEQTKLAGELLVRERWGDGFPATVVRPGLVYGPGDMHLLGFFCSVQRHLFRPIGRRPVWLHPIYIADMTEALIRAANDPRAIGEAFNIAGEQPVTIEALAATIATALGVRQTTGFIPLPVARALAFVGDALPANLRHAAPLTRSRVDFLTHSRLYDVDKARRLLDFVARTPLAEGIARTVDWYHREGHLPAPGGSTVVAPSRAAV